MQAPYGQQRGKLPLYPISSDTLNTLLDYPNKRLRITNPIQMELSYHINILIKKYYQDRQRDCTVQYALEQVVTSMLNDIDNHDNLKRYIFHLQRP